MYIISESTSYGDQMKKREKNEKQNKRKRRNVVEIKRKENIVHGEVGFSFTSDKV